MSWMNCSVLVSSVLACYVWSNTGVLCRSGETAYSPVLCHLCYLSASSRPPRGLISFHLSLLNHTSILLLHPPDTASMFLHASCGCLAALHVCAHHVAEKNTHSSSPPHRFSLYLKTYTTGQLQEAAPLSQGTAPTL